MAKAVKSQKFNIRVKPLTSLKAWEDLKGHAREVAKLHLRMLFAEDAHRGERLTAEVSASSSTTRRTASPTRL